MNRATVTLVLKPPGRGNWATTQVTIAGPDVRPLLFKAGESYQLGPKTYRISEVKS